MMQAKRNIAVTVLLLVVSFVIHAQKNSKPNIVLIYTDDLGYGDISCNGYSAIQTPNIDKLAKKGVNFTNAHSTSATCTPSRYSLLTGQYAWRKDGTGIAPGDASLLIPTTITSLPGLLKKAGYQNAVIGKWHLGLGGKEGPEWNGKIAPGPLEIGFDYSFLIPATGDRVPCVFVENHHVVNLDQKDPITVNYKEPVDPNAPTGKNNPELLKMHPSHEHDNSIVNGVSRIGYMKGGKAALWKDEDFADVFVRKAGQFITDNKSKPFFLFFSTHDIHVPRLAHERFVGKSGMGPRGDVLLQLDWTVGEIYKILEENKLLKNTLIIFTSDNGQVIDDGYKDESVEKLGTHKPGGNFRGGKYSAFEAGTRVPFIVSWKGKVKAGKKSDALFSQVDFYASFAKLVGVPVEQNMAADSRDYLSTLLNQKSMSREYLVEHSLTNTLSVIKGNWKYIEPSGAMAFNKKTNTELGNLKAPQLYDLSTDPGEKNNLAEKYPEKLTEMKNLLESVKQKK
ncbi:MAG TPA: sulfatase-like hydrolase/transferase [Chitinophagaceae bacterium]|nr:sulfatase-like hydrolase/transferase [Chitinophagaceae bacterium]